MGPAGSLPYTAGGNGYATRPTRRLPWAYAWIGFCGGRGSGGGCCGRRGSSGRRTAIPTKCGSFPVSEDGKRAAPFSPRCCCVGGCTSCSTGCGSGRQSVPAAISAPEQYVRRAAEYIRANFARPITVEGLAGAMGIDRRLFSPDIYRVHGDKSSGYLVGFRLARPRRCWPTGGARWGRRPKSVGYEDALPSFSRMYKKAVWAASLRHPGRRGRCPGGRG